MLLSASQSGAAGRDRRDEGERLDSRVAYRGRLEGRYYLDKWYDTEMGRQVPPCTVNTLLPDAATFLGAIPAELNDRAFIHLPNGIGLLRGRISRVIGHIMTMAIHHAAEHQRTRLAAHILWFDQMSHVRTTDRRSFPRFPPANPETVIALEDGRLERCRLVDISPSGAAVWSGLRPALESRVVLGQVSGVVARHTRVGFAVRFTQLQNPALLDEVLAPPEQLRDVIALPDTDADAFVGAGAAPLGEAGAGR